MGNINKDDDLARAKQSFLKAAKRTCRVSMWYSAQGTIDALSYLRIACATRDELRMCSRSLRRQPINAQNELRCFQTLSNMCNRQLKRYPTTMKADDDALEHGGLNPFCDKRHAIIVVRGEKEISTSLSICTRRWSPYSTPRRPWLIADSLSASTRPTVPT